METPGSAHQDQPPGQDVALIVALKSMESRIAALEQLRESGSFKKIRENAGAIALFLGLILTFASLRDVFISKPEADRIATISQFNRAVSSAAQIRQETIQFQMQSNDPALRLALASAALPRVLGDVATARALLPSMKDSDVGIPQLITLINESFSAGDLPTAQDFVMRGVRKTDVSPFLRSEAKRYQAKYLYATGNPADARRAYQDALALIGESPASAAARAYDVTDWIVVEYMWGDCATAEALLNQRAPELRSPLLPPAVRDELAATLVGQLRALGGRCRIPENLKVLLSG